MRKIKWLIPLLLLALLPFALSQRLEVSEYEIHTSKLSGEYTFAVASDLHNSFYGEKQEQLISAILHSGADALLLPGDMADSYAELTGLRTLIEGLNGALPIFYTTGNHECASMEHEEIKAELRRLGVTVLEGTSAMLGEIRIAGTDDPLCLYRQEWLDQVDSLRAADDTFTLLLSHRPDRIEYCDTGFDLVVSGHAHGGQVRIPYLLPGLYAPNQGWFPEYTSGLYSVGEAQLFVTRGLCKNAVPRLFNRPELAILRVTGEPV
ncbi:MAG: metallophosphoesterase [Clostridia bacterium]|nr:metallophosphoesterase [Clostridia bacterium]